MATGLGSGTGLELETKVAEDYTKFYNQPLPGPSPGPFIFKTLLRHYAKRTLTSRFLNMKLGPRRNYHKGQAAVRHYANQPVPHDFCVGVPISCLLTVGSTPV